MTMSKNKKTFLSCNSRSSSKSELLVASQCFNQNYFKSIYPQGETIDGDFNAKEHALYLKYLFQLQGYHPSSLYDFGFGKGTLLREVAKKLECSRVGGCDVSEYALKKLQAQKWAHGWKLEQSSIHELQLPVSKTLKKKKAPYHLGLCNSVLQYMQDDEVDVSLQIMSRQCQYVYLHVPSLEDYILLKKDLKFKDPYALHRKNSFYLKKISQYFYFVSWGLLESKRYTSHRTSIFTDSIYRY